MLRRALASALRAGRHTQLVTADSPTTERQPPEIGATLGALLLLWCASATVADRAGLAWYWWPPAITAVVTVFLIVAWILPEVPLGVLLVAVFFGGAAIEIDQDGNLWLTYGVPIVLVLLIALMTRTINVRSARDLAVAAAAFVRSAPLLAPLALVVLVLPALSADLWQAAGQLGSGDLLMLVSVTAVPLFAIVGVELNNQLPSVLKHGAERLARTDDRAELTLRLLHERLADEPYKLIEFACSGQVATSWPHANAAEYAPLIAASEGDALKRSLWGRLGLCVIVVAVSLTAYLYVILATVIDPHVAHAWAHEDIPTWDFRLFGSDVFVPGGVYLQVVALLGALATATFLAFALLEDRFSTALADALLRLPADRLLALAVPYLALREERVESDSDDLDDWDPGSVNSPNQPEALEEPTPAEGPN
jgi:hypothetical protein